MEERELEKIGEGLYYSPEDDNGSKEADRKIQEPDLYVKVRDVKPRTVERKDSPFVYHAGAELLTEKAKERKGMSVIGAFETGLLKADAKKVISYFATYRYLNAHLIKRLLNEEKETDDEHVKRILSNLYRLGIVVRHRISYTDNEGVIHTSSFIYALSEKYKRTGMGRKIGENTKIDNVLPDCCDMLSRLAFNQFYISITETYGMKLALATYKPESSLYQSEVFFKSGRKTVALGVVPVRMCAGWEKKVSEILNRAEGETRWTVFLAETETAAVAINRIVKRDCPESGMRVLYLCDYATNDGMAPFDYMIMQKEEAAYSVVRLNVD